VWPEGSPDDPYDLVYGRPDLALLAWRILA
jgi:hypothetical protein